MGAGSLFSFSKNEPKFSYSETAMQNFKKSPGTILRTPVLGKVCFRSPKMYQNSPTAIEDSKIQPEKILRTFVLREEI